MLLLRVVGVEPVFFVKFVAVVGIIRTTTTTTGFFVVKVVVGAQILLHLANFNNLEDKLQDEANFSLGGK